MHLRTTTTREDSQSYSWCRLQMSLLCRSSKCLFLEESQLICSRKTTKDYSRVVIISEVHEGSARNSRRRKQSASKDTEEWIFLCAFDLLRHERLQWNVVVFSPKWWHDCREERIARTGLVLFHCAFWLTVFVQYVVVFLPWIPQWVERKTQRRLEGHETCGRMKNKTIHGRKDTNKQTHKNCTTDRVLQEETSLMWLLLVFFDDEERFSLNPLLLNKKFWGKWEKEEKEEHRRKELLQQHKHTTCCCSITITNLKHGENFDFDSRRRLFCHGNLLYKRRELLKLTVKIEEEREQVNKEHEKIHSHELCSVVLPTASAVWLPSIGFTLIVSL